MERPAGTWLRTPLRLDIDHWDLLFGLLGCCAGGKDREALTRRLLGRWADCLGAMVCLSVRSGLDLYLQARGLPLGSEILVSAISHPDIFAIIKAHGLVPVPVDLDFDTAAPTRETVERALGPASCALLVAHLFGGRADLEELSALCQMRGLELWEDCAETFGGGYTGHPEAALTLFSFGPLKTCSALGGAIVRVRRGRDLECMQRIQRAYPEQPTSAFLRRLVQYGFLRAMSTRPRLYGCFHCALRALGRDPTELVRSIGKSFGHGLRIEALRLRPPVALLRLLDRRLASFDGKIVRARRRLVQRVSAGLRKARRPGARLQDHAHWLFPLCVDDRQAAMEALREVGYDPLPGLSNLTTCPPPADRPELAPQAAETMVRSALLVPLHPGIPGEEAVRVAGAIERSQGRDLALPVLHAARREHPVRPSWSTGEMAG